MIAEYPGYVGVASEIMRGPVNAATEVSFGDPNYGYIYRTLSNDASECVPFSYLDILLGQSRSGRPNLALKLRRDCKCISAADGDTCLYTGVL